MSVPPDQIYNHAELIAIYDQINSGREDFDFYRACSLRRQAVS